MVTPNFILIQRLIPETERLADMGLRIGIAVVLGFLFQRALFLLVNRSKRWIERAGHGSPHSLQRARTVGLIFRSLFTVVVGGAVVIYSLGVMGWDVRPLLATAGIAGVALGFGAQSVVRDLIAGIFIIAEDQFGVGDLIEVNGRVATVEALTVRSTTLRDFNGFLHFVPNGEMKVVTNRSRGWNRMAVDVPIGADQDADQALEACRKVAAAMNAEPAWRTRILDDIQVWGLESLGGQELQIRLAVRAAPGPDGDEAARELRRRLHRALGEAGVRLRTRPEIGIARMEAPVEPPAGAPAS